MKTLILLILFVGSVFGGGGEYSYNEEDEFGPSKWDQVNAQCGGRFQTPININTSNVIVIKRPPIKTTYFNKRIRAIKLKNDGDDISFRFTFADEKENSFVFDCQTYVFDHAHLHWGDAQAGVGGSEHTVNGIRYAAEAHFVHYNKKYGSVANSLGYNDGLAVFGYFLQLSNPPAKADFSYLNYIDNVVTAGSEFIINLPTNFKLAIKDIVKGDIKKYYYYRGSLTTPPCSPVVQWIVSTTPLKFFRPEWEALNKLQDTEGSPILINFRPIQQQGWYRQVYANSK